MRHVEHVAVCVLAYKSEENAIFPRRYRLLRREGFSRILHQRAQIKSWFAVHSDNNSAGHARLGITVSKRVLPAASQRNKLKRIIRECFRTHARKSVARDVVVRLRSSLNKSDIPAARSTLLEMLEFVLATK